MGDPAEILVVLMTALILPGIAILVAAFLTGGLESTESVKYMALVGEPDGWERDGFEEPEPCDALEERRCAP